MPERQNRVRLHDQDETHNVDACYSITNEYGMRHVPTLLCTCGHRSSALTWEEAGADFDAHLPKRNT